MLFKQLIQHKNMTQWLSSENGRIITLRMTTSTLSCRCTYTLWPFYNVFIRYVYPSGVPISHLTVAPLLHHNLFAMLPCYYRKGPPIDHCFILLIHFNSLQLNKYKYKLSNNSNISEVGKQNSKGEGGLTHFHQ